MIEQKGGIDQQEIQLKDTMTDFWHSKGGHQYVESLEYLGTFASLYCAVVPSGGRVD